MSEQVINKKEQKEFTPEMAFMGFLMATAALIGIWFLPVILVTVAKIVS
jgi:hypothetical protein